MTKYVKIAVYEGETRVEYVELPGDVSDYDIIINSSTTVDFPSKEKHDNPPQLPEVDVDDIEAESNERTYTSMRDNPESLPARIRRSVYQRQLLTRVQLEAWLSANDYSTRSGGVREALIVLETVTEEIKRVGKGDDQQIVWVGKD